MDLSYFQEENEQGEVITRTRDETVAWDDLANIMKLVKPVWVIDKFVSMVILGEQWQWFDDYQEHLTKLAEVNEFNANLPVIGSDENDADIFAEPKILPVMRVRPALVTVDKFKTNHAALFISYNKKQGVEINGSRVSLNKDNADGLVSIKSGYELAGSAIFPTNFIADNAHGTVSITFADYAEFTNFALQFLAARNEFFK